MSNLTEQGLQWSGILNTARLCILSLADIGAWAVVPCLAVVGVTIDATALSALAATLHERTYNMEGSDAVLQPPTTCVLYQLRPRSLEKLLTTRLTAELMLRGQ